MLKYSLIYNSSDLIMQHKQKARLYIEKIPESIFALSAAQSHYLLHVLKFKIADKFRIFNGVQGEFEAEIIAIKRKVILLEVKKQHVPPLAKKDTIWLCFAPLKRDRSNLIAEKATELGVDRIFPILTQQSDVRRLHERSFNANLIEAAEQCGRIDIPSLESIQKLNDFLKHFPNERTLFICAESGNVSPIFQAFKVEKNKKIAFLIGPAGGFSKAEFLLFERYSFIREIGLGVEILRAETAAIAALSIWQAIKGSWS